MSTKLIYAGIYVTGPRDETKLNKFYPVREDGKIDKEHPALFPKKGKNLRLVGRIYECEVNGESYSGWKDAGATEDKDLIREFYAKQSEALHRYNTAKETKKQHEDTFERLVLQMLKDTEGMNYLMRTSLGEYVKQRIIRGK